MERTVISLPGMVLGQTTFLSDKIKASGYYAGDSGKTVVSILLYNFVGNFIIEGTLAKTPEESDWAQISSTTYPIIPTMPEDVSGDKGTKYYEINGNYLYVRFKVNRDNFETLPPDLSTIGFVEKIMVAVI